MTYMDQLSELLQTEKDAKHDFEKILNELLERGFSYKDLAYYLLRFPETLIQPKSL